MAEQQRSTQDATAFAKKIRKPHRRINPCFMTGKGCVHTEHIDSEIEQRVNKIAGFNIRPFQPNIEAAHRLSLERFLQDYYSTTDCELRLAEADKVRRTGYVVCEKICRRIQASDFVVVDISAPNANVFYELGLAYGIDQKILVIHQASSDFGKKAADCLQDGGCRCYPYKDLLPIGAADLVLSNNLWIRDTLPHHQSNLSPTIALITYSYGFLAWASGDDGSESESNGTRGAKIDHTPQTQRHPVEDLLGPNDISLGFESHIKAAVGVAVDNIVEKLRHSPPRGIMEKYIELVKGLKSADQVKRDASFQDVRKKIEQSFCTIIQTGSKVSDPMAYFWLGYCHALGKNVIPVTVVESPNDDIDDLAFDLRALWHMSFIRNDPTRFSEELEETLQQMVMSDFTEWSRSKFWDEVLGRRGKVSIFTGALHNEPIGREMIGDWDLRAVSELTSYFASHQYRATIESPVYQIEQVTGNDAVQAASVTREEYFLELEEMLRGKNCIVIASPDVNPLTEILLGRLYDIDRDKWFKVSKGIKNETAVVIAFKEVDVVPKDRDTNKQTQGNQANDNHTPDLARAFYSPITINRLEENKGRLRRGFLGHGVDKGLLEGKFLSQTDDKSPFSVHAHLVVARNPFDKDPLEQHHVIILNGVSGPATFALTHVLTGGTSSQFVTYPEEFLPDSESEGFLQQLNQDLPMIKDRFFGLQYFFEVDVGPTDEESDDGETPLRDIFDWRRILSWKRVADVADCTFGKGAKPTE